MEKTVTVEIKRLGEGNMYGIAADAKCISLIVRVQGEGKTGELSTPIPVGHEFYKLVQKALDNFPAKSYDIDRLTIEDLPETK